jgi:chemotaxis signal transduction protein
VRGVVRLTDEEIETRPPALAGREGEYVHGIARPRGGGMLILLGLDPVLKFALPKRQAEAAR